MRSENVFFSHREGFIKKQSGFTLIEIVVALLVISIALGAVISTTASSVDMADHIRNKTIALWVAKNYLSEMAAEKKWPDTGKTSAGIEMNKHIWMLQSNIIQTANTNMKKVEVRVFFEDKDKQPLLSLTGFINRPVLNRSMKR